jgi:hypothetical protein
MNNYTHSNNETKILTNNKLINKGFSLLHELFLNNDWMLTINLFNHICYSKKNFETEFFEIILDKKKVYVSIPLKNSIFQYKTSFDNYASACDYVEKMFIEFINDKNNININ